MKFLLSIFIFLIFVSFSYAQEITNTNENPKSVLFDEFGQTNNSDIESRIDRFFIKLYEDPNSRGQFIIYGTETEILKLETFMMNYIRFRGFDTNRISPRRAGYLKESKTEFWIIPAGAEPPEIEPKPHKIAEFGKVGKSVVSKQMQKFNERLRSEPTATGYIIIDGRESDAARYEKYVRESIRFRTFRANRLTIVRGDSSKPLKLTLWLIPAGLSLDDLDLS